MTNGRSFLGLTLAVLLQAPADTPETLGDPTQFDSGTEEPSGVAWDEARQKLYVIGDEGTLAVLDRDGRRLSTRFIGGNLEDAAVHTPSGRLVLLAEQSSSLIVYDPDTGQHTGRFRLDRGALLGRKFAEPAASNTGFEGLAFRPERAYAGGGVFYLAHQRDPAVIVAVAFDPTQADGELGADAVVTRWSLPFSDATAVTYVPGLDRLMLLSNKSNRVAILGLDGRALGEVVLPGTQQEGLAIDGAGQLWVADDRAGVVLRFESAIPALRAALAYPREATEKQRARTQEGEPDE